VGDGNDGPRRPWTVAHPDRPRASWRLALFHSSPTFAGRHAPRPWRAQHDLFLQGARRYPDRGRVPTRYTTWGASSSTAKAQEYADLLMAGTCAELSRTNERLTRAFPPYHRPALAINIQAHRSSRNAFGLWSPPRRRAATSRIRSATLVVGSTAVRNSYIFGSVRSPRRWRIALPWKLEAPPATDRHSAVRLPAAQSRWTVYEWTGWTGSAWRA
jgi:hypothetical protein